MKICTKCAPDSCSDPVAHAVFMTPTKGKATPGPWHNHSTNFGYGPRHVCGPKHADGGDYAPICIADTEANAHLISSAPSLLEAVKFAAGFVARHKRKDDGMNLHEQLLAVIRAAEGE